MTLTAYTQLNFKEINPFVFDYIRPVLYGIVRNDFIQLSIDTGKIMYKKSLSFHNFSDDFANKKTRLRNMIEKYDSEFLEVGTTGSKSEKLSYIKKFLPIEHEIKHEATIHSLISKPEGKMPVLHNDYKKHHNQHVGNTFVVKKCELYIQNMLGTEQELKDSDNVDNSSSSDKSDNDGRSGSNTDSD
mmetsp:Transcript_20532/g.41096  ORF Transcript_20532/g.41096 Transcript_20532/m.41096 type:complete len:187 (-) Transcript_20532:64-624(-)